MTKRAVAIIAAGFLTVSIAYSIRYGYGMLLPRMLTDLKISKAQAGAIFSTYFIVYTLATPVVGALSDRFNYRFILTLFTALMAGGALMMAFAANLLQSHLFFSLAGLGHAACWAPVTALVQKWVPDQKRGAALSIMTMGVGAGILSWGTLLPAIVTHAGWRTGWSALGMTGLFIAVANYFLVRNPMDEPSATTAPVNWLQFWASYRDRVLERNFWIIGSAYLLVGFNVIIPFTFLPVYAQDALSLPYDSATRLVATIALAGLAGQLTLGLWSDRIGRIRVMMVCGVIMGAACLGMSMAATPWTLYAFTAVYGLGYGAVWPVYAAAARDHFPKHQTGGIVGLWTVFLGVGSVVSPALAGWTIDRSGSYTLAFLFGLASGLISSVLLVWAKGGGLKGIANPKTSNIEPPTRNDE